MKSFNWIDLYFGCIGQKIPMMTIIIYCGPPQLEAAVIIQRHVLITTSIFSCSSGAPHVNNKVYRGVFRGALGHGPLWPKHFFDIEKKLKTWLAPSFVWALVASENSLPPFFEILNTPLVVYVFLEFGPGTRLSGFKSWITLQIQVSTDCGFEHAGTNIRQVYNIQRMNGLWACFTCFTCFHFLTHVFLYYCF